MSCELLSGGKVDSESLSLETDTLTHKCILRGKLLDYAGNQVEDSINLNGFISNVDGKFMWGGGNFSKRAESVRLDGDKLTGLLRYSNGDWNETPQVIDLDEHIYNINGRFTYLPGHRPHHEPGYVIKAPGPRWDGNIDAATFAVASDGPRNRCRIAYKTSIDEKISLAEVAFRGKTWGLPTQIDVYPDTVPGQNLAFTYHPENEKTRSLFFSEENGNGYIYQQTFNSSTGEWNEPHMLKTNRKSEGLKAHRFTKYAAAYYKPTNHSTSSKLLLYYVDESNYLQESVGEQDRTSKKWYWRSAAVVSSVLAKSFLAVTQRGETTFLVYRDLNLNLCLLEGSNRDGKLGRATWHSENPIILCNANELLKDSPLAIAARCNGDTVTIFFVQRDGQKKIISSIDHIPGSKLHFAHRRVGRMEPDSILGAASFPDNHLYDVRQFSVSNLDGENILVERIPRYYAQGEGGHVQQWALSGGVIDTDVDDLVARVKVQEESDSE